jgi:DNA end-binding protein Ku
VPDGLAAQHPYGVLAAALGQAGQGALGRVVLGGHRHLVLVRPAGQLLVLDLLHYPGQVRPAAPWEAQLRAGPATAQELALAGQLLQAASGPVDWAQYRDTTADELAALVQAKLANRPVVTPDPDTGSGLPFLEALKQSVAAARAQPPAAPARKARAARRAGG